MAAHGTPTPVPNAHLSSVLLASSQVNNSTTLTDNTTNRTELDSHANMVVLGAPSTVLNTTGKTVSVNPFSPDFSPLEVPLVDGATLYECPHTLESYVLIFTNALLVPKMSHNLIPPFILREAGITVRDVPKIHVNDPTPDDHTIYLPRSQLRIPLHLHGIFSYFHCRKPSHRDLHTFSENAYLVTPLGEWDPNTDQFSTNEANMCDHEGNVVASHSQPVRLILDDSPIPEYILEALNVHSLSSKPTVGCTIAPLCVGETV